MSLNMKKLLSSAVLLLITASIFCSCAEERDPIDRVQPYALPKTFFIGDDFQSLDDDPEFWSQNTLIDVGFGVSQNGLFTSTYAQPMSRLKWQINEKYLIARASYEHIDNSDNFGKTTGLSTQNGIIVAAFPITKHFDVINSYNPTTGEKLNVIEENSYDRPWFEREYIRVDFSRNANTDAYAFDTLSLVGLYGGISYEPLSYWVSDPRDKEAPVFDLENGYFDVTTKAFARPGMIDLSHLGWGRSSFPACMLGSDFFGGTKPVGTCNPVELTLRHSFRRVEDTDYQPMEWDGWKFQAFGGFVVERYGYSRKYGMTDERHHRLLTRYPIWQRHHYYDNPETLENEVRCYIPTEEADDTLVAGSDVPREVGTPWGGEANRDEDGNGTADECEAVAILLGNADRGSFQGSQCDTFKQKCTLPFQARERKPIVWYVTNDSNLKFFAGTKEATQHWDTALRTAVKTAQYVECLETSDDENSCKKAFPMYFGQQTDNHDAFQLSKEMDLCREAGNDEEICGTQIDAIADKRGYSEGVVAIAKDPEMIVLCHSPVQFDDHELCAPEDERLPEGVIAEDCVFARDNNDNDTLDICLAARNVRKGDLRYNQVNLIEAPQSRSPWGIYTDAEDPLTGETISSSINVWTWVNDVWSQRLIDQLRFAGGELSASDITEAKNVKNWAKASEMMSRGGSAPAVTREEFNRRIDGLSGRSVDSLNTGLTLKQEFENIDPSVKESMVEFVDQSSSIVFDAYQSSTTSARYNARLAAIAGTEIESELMNKYMQQLTGLDSMYASNGALNVASPVRGGNLSVRSDMERMKQLALGDRGMCEMKMAVPSPNSTNGLANIMQEKFGYFDPESSLSEQNSRSERMADYVAQRVHMSVIVHEMGHSMAHRHNFVGSSDSYNYRPQYWQLRTDNGDLAGSPVDDLSDDPTGELGIGPRYFDPVTKNESDNLIWMWQHSSVMDYHGEMTQDFLGLGAYDIAALRFFYGDSIAVYPEEYAPLNAGPTTIERNRVDGIMMKMDNFGGMLGMSPYAIAIDTKVHYTLLQYYFDLIQDCKEVNIKDFVPSDWNEETHGKWNAVLDGEIVAVDGVYQRCRQQEVEYASWHNMRAAAAAEVPHYDNGGTAYIKATDDDFSLGKMMTQDGRLRVPYGFATDGWADTGNVAVYRHDSGADSYEIFNFLASQQEIFHIFNTYRRGRATFSLAGSVAGTQSRIVGKMRDGSKGLALMKNIIMDSSSNSGTDPLQMWSWYVGKYWSDSMMASSFVFDHITKMAQRPHAGLHSKDADNIYRAVDNWDSATDEMKDGQVIVPNGAYATSGKSIMAEYSSGGALLENQLSSVEGEFDSYYVQNRGSYYDKIYTAMNLSESADNFISASRDDFFDKRYRACSMADLLPDGYRRWIANNLTNDDFIKGVKLIADENGDPIVDENGMTDESIGFTQWWGKEPTSCFSKNGTNICRKITSVNGETKWQDIGDDPQDVVNVESQFGWEVHKFLIALTHVYLPENDKQNWRNMLWMFEFVGDGLNYGVDNRIELHHPSGKSYMARTYGKEEIFGKTVEKGISARVLEYANEMMRDAYYVDWYDSNGVLIPTHIDIVVGSPTEGEQIADDSTQIAVWYIPVMDANNEPNVKYYPGMMSALGTYGSDGEFIQSPIADCNDTDDSGCECIHNKACWNLQSYMTLIEWMKVFSGSADFGVSGWNDMIGIYG